MERKPFHDAVLRIIQTLPAGSVTTYGDLAKAAGHPNSARIIGGVLYRLRTDNPQLVVPWYRVVNASGRISIDDVSRQQRLLEKEGVEFLRPGVIKDFDRIRFPLDLLLQ